METKNNKAKSVLTITLNPCIDKNSTVVGIVPEKKLRCSTPKFEPGGGGINVSRALKRLEIDSHTLFTSGGKSGKLLEELLKEEKLLVRPLRVSNETRENFIVVDVLNNQQYRFGFPGEPFTKNEETTILNAIEELESFPEITVISGSLPDSMSPVFLKSIIQICKRKNSKVIVDTSGKSLETAAEEGVYLLKPNLNELASMAGKTELTGTSLDDTAWNLITKRAAEVVVVSLGASGAALYHNGEKIQLKAPVVKVRSTVGAGDSMVAGMVFALASGGSMDEILRMGIACGSATTMEEGTGLFQAVNAFRLFSEVQN